MEKKQNKIMVERETFEFNGKSYYSYVIKGKVRGRDVKIAVCPPDRGGWAVMDIVFGDSNQAELVATPYEIKDEKTGNIIKGNTYAVRTSDENGEVYECNIKPSRVSDKMLFNMLMR